MDCKYTSREQWSSIQTASTPVESSGVLYELSVHQQRVVEFYMDCQYTSREQWSSLWTVSTPIESSGVLRTVSTPVESSGVLYGLPVHQQRVVEFYMDSKYTSRELLSSIWTVSTLVESSGVLYGLSVHQQRVVEFSGLSVHQQRVVEFYTDCQYTSREQWSSI